jgi:capsular exopolysaccharide synthesis family protein
LTSAAEIQQVQDQIAELEEVRSVYQSAYADLLDVYRAESPNVLSLFDPAVVPQKPIPSKTKLIVAIAGAAGLGLALGAIFVMEYLDTSVHWEGEGMQSLLDVPLLGVVPQVSRREALLSDNPLSPVMEGVRAVRANVFLMRPDQPFRTLLLTSPGTSEGKSLILANLAVALAAAGDRVIVVDADLRKPALHEMFDQPNVLGLANVLNSRGPDGKDFSSIPLQDTGFDNVYLLTGGQAAIDPATLLTSSRLPALLEFLKGQADVILMDSPPILGPPDATVLATRAEGTILVVSAGFTGRRMVQQARDRLRGQKETNLLGLVMNRVKLHGDSYYYYGAGSEGGEPWPEGADGKHPKEPGRSGRIRPPLYGKGGDQTWLTLGEAARRLGISRARARQWCKSGRLTAARKGLRWRIAPDEIQRIFEDALERGRQYDGVSRLRG